MVQQWMNQQRHPWSVWTNPEEAARRAGGRRHYNSLRQLRAALRRRAVIELLCQYGFDYGSQRRIATRLGVSPATISRDVQLLRTWWLARGGIIWPADLRTPKTTARIIARMSR